MSVYSISVLQIQHESHWEIQVMPNTPSKKDILLMTDWNAEVELMEEPEITGRCELGK